MDYRCNKLPPARTREAWNEEHGPHGEPTRDDPKEQPPPGTYRIRAFRCPCGARFVDIEGKALTGGEVMSWSVSAIGRPAAVAAKLEKEFSMYKCAEPEESIKQAAKGVVLAAVNGFPEDALVLVQASGHQQSGETKGTDKAQNTLQVKIEPVYGFIE